MNLSEALQNQNVKAFLWTIRVGEGTANDNGYHTLVGGSQFPSLDSHPHTSVSITFRNGRTIRSTAAGAYQFLAGTWDNLVKQYGFTDFSENSQDQGAVALIRGRNALDDIINGDIETAIRKCNKEWASLPESPYGQPTRTMAQALVTYKQAGGDIK